MPDESSMVPFGPSLSPGMLATELDAAEFREKLAVRGLLAAITITQPITTTTPTEQIQKQKNQINSTEK